MTQPADEPMVAALSVHLNPILARAVLTLSLSRTKLSLERLGPADGPALQAAIERGLKLYIHSPPQLRRCMQDVARVISGVTQPVPPPVEPPSSTSGRTISTSKSDVRAAERRGPSSSRSNGGNGSAVASAAKADVYASAVAIGSAAVRAPPQPAAVSSRFKMVVPIRDENDIVVARGRGREMCDRMGFSSAVQIKLATIISELARNIVQYAGQGEITMTAVLGETPGFEVLAEDRGPGIPNLDHVMSDSYRSKRGLGIGLKGTRKMMDEFEIWTNPGGGTRVRVCKYLR
ncbi:MAG: anti-sigma regulatory factor [Deltaproteobacteria bacterium]|nr:anti-sigma regulatory factor [Deltaproteobacteria bacterium]